jgi:hypothetical protein
MLWKSRFAGARTRLLLTVLTATAVLGAGEVSGAQLTASWVDNSNGLASTQLERRLGTDTTYVVVADVPPGLTAYADASVSSSTTYCYRAFAYDADGVSPYTDDVCATTASDPLNVTVSKSGTGTGTVASTPGGINCGTTCSATYPAGTSVALAATPDIGSVFTGWSSGGCAGTATCTLAGNAPVAVTASFSLVTYPLTVTTAGPGTVTSSPSGINCGSVCSATYPSGAGLTLTATPNKNTLFTGWQGGGCSGTAATCTITMNAATAVSATFARKSGPAK